MTSESFSVNVALSFRVSDYLAVSVAITIPNKLAMVQHLYERCFRGKSSEGSYL
jgi:hypothetical protein